MDGASELTQQPVQPGAEFLYDFEPPDAGILWYHSHRRAFEQYARPTFPVRGMSRKARLPAPAQLAPNPVPPLGDLSKARHATLRMDGGAMGRMRQAMLGVRTVGERELAEQGEV